jgi:tetratricopeptide (TPR) repeat protein
VTEPPASGVPVEEPPTQPQPESAAVAFEVPATAAVEESAPPPPLHLRPAAAAGDKDEHFINSAREYIDKGSLNEAMAEYSKLIKRNKLLEESIYDLQEIVYRYPVDVIVWQTLGDAYMRSNRLQEALDAYTKAEELLR